MSKDDADSRKNLVPHVSNAHKLGSGRVTRAVVALLVVLLLAGLVGLLVL
ncbi:hypothetical protein [Mobiluncus curtisii]|nr:hypothetical protein [Mobiluncus curtisii]NMW44796.1 hypothetical protein [Mobiluncus curtisii]NMW49039.1 hypothetical protein [Mobiluncus curtisii]NMW82941.1 hypothetical protein [Mobiluncus curtisii]NMX13451.1 hypothetical protein [Mobiluncus curtisii]